MGTRHGDQPPEHWAGPGSLDPTPVWKQYVLVALLLAASLVLIAVVAAFSLAPYLAEPPALVPGGRVVLARDVLPEVGAPAVKVADPLLPPEQAFWLYRPDDSEVLAARALWWPSENAAPCPVHAEAPAAASGAAFRAECPDAEVTFGPRGEPITAERGLDRYLVSVDGERVIVNVGRVIRGAGMTPQPPVPPIGTR
ncbi:MAG TPA: hypothetical protein VMJ92_02960 [Candidatus Limnocylindrales bacterium]|nr:hypothetical protein [Candidatus Limnocylindrales bacterium]